MNENSIKTTDNWAWWKIIKHVIFPKPKDAPRAGKKEISARILVAMVILAVFAFFKLDYYLASSPQLVTDAPETPSSEETAPHYPYGVNQADLDNYMPVLDLASRGNYQAQRNIAYGFVAHPYHNQQMNPVLGCAWYLVVLNSASQKVDVTDQSNAELYCGRLDPDLLETAKQHATKFLAEINEKAKLGKLDD
jgi:hypothetical protein